MILHGHCNKLLVIRFIERWIFHGEYSIEFPFDLVVIWRLLGHDSDTIVGQAGKERGVNAIVLKKHPVTHHSKVSGS